MKIIIVQDMCDRAIVVELFSIVNGKDSVLWKPFATLIVLLSSCVMEGNIGFGYATVVLFFDLF